MSKSLTDTQNQHARVFVRALVDSDFGGNITAAARALEVGTATLADFLRGSRGAGAKLLLAVADHAKTSVSEVTGDEAPRLFGDAPIVRARELPGWDAAIAWVRTAKGSAFNEGIARTAGHVSLDNPPAMSPIVVLRLYEFVEAALSQGWDTKPTNTAVSSAVPPPPPLAPKRAPRRR